LEQLQDDTLTPDARVHTALATLARARGRPATTTTSAPLVPQTDLPQGYTPPRGTLSFDERSALVTRRACLRCRLDGHSSSHCPYQTALDRYYADILRQRRGSPSPGSSGTRSAT
jgi:hypothetical protein